MTRYIDGFLGASHQLKTGFENWWTPTGTDGFNIFDDTRMRYTGSGRRLQRHGQHRLRRRRSVPVQHAADAGNEDAQLRRRSSRIARPTTAFTVNLGLRWSYYDGTIPAQSNGGGEWGAVCAACNESYPGSQDRRTAGTRSRRAPASCAS